MEATQSNNTTQGMSVWSVVFGIIMVVLGLVAIAYMGLSDLSSMMLLGWLLVVGGALQIILSYFPSQRSHLFLGLFVGLMYLVVGLAMLVSPTALVASLTLYLSLFFMVNGLYKIVVSAIDRFHNWGWVAFNGIVSLLFGLYLWGAMSVVSVGLVSGFIGLELILWGVSFFFVPYASAEEMHQGIGTMHHQSR